MSHQHAHSHHFAHAVGGGGSSSATTTSATTASTEYAQSSSAASSSGSDSVPSSSSSPHEVVLDLFADPSSTTTTTALAGTSPRRSSSLELEQDMYASYSDLSYDSSGESPYPRQHSHHRVDLSPRRRHHHHHHHLAFSGDEEGGGGSVVSSRAPSPTPRDHWDIHSPSVDLLGFRSVSRNRSRTPTGATTPVSGAFEKDGRYGPDYFNAHLYQTSALLRKLGGTLAPENSPVLQHKRRRPGWWARRAETRRRNSYSSSQAPPPSSSSTSKSGRNRSCLSMFGAALLRQPWVPTQPCTILFSFLLLGCFAATVTTFLVHVLSTDKQPLPWRTFCQDQRPFPHDLADSLAPTSVFVGIFSVDATYERRQAIRSTYLRHTRPIDPVTGRAAQNVQLKFILGRPRPSHARRVALEMEMYNDIVVLDLKENMNRGKTYAYFKWAAENATVPMYYRRKGDGISPDEVSIGFKKADYVVKADDDSFINLAELERHLRVIPREKTYWGYLIRNLFMAGEGYALSSDLVQYVATYEPLKAYTTGPEDKRVSKWMRMHPNYSMINWVSERCWIYDHPKAGTTYSHGFLFPDEVERIRTEGRRGIDEEERIRRGGDLSQAYSTVTQWKTPYATPLDQLSIEEEVEALVEGGGRWVTFRADEGKGPASLKWDSVVFNPSDERIVSQRQKQPLDPVAAGVTPGVPDRSRPVGTTTPSQTTSRTTKFGKDLFRDPEDVEAVRNVKRSFDVADFSVNVVEVHNAVHPPATDAVDEDEREWTASLYAAAKAASNSSSPAAGTLYSSISPTTSITSSSTFPDEGSPATDSPATGDEAVATPTADAPPPPSTTTSDEPYRNEPTGQIRFPAHNYILPPSSDDRYLPPPTLRYDPAALALRHRRMQGRPHGGTVMVHFLKRNEWFLETALAFLGRERLWDQGVDAPLFDEAFDRLHEMDDDSLALATVPSYQGVGKVEPVPAYWGGPRMYGSPIVQANGHVAAGRPAEAHREIVPNSGALTSRLGGVRGVGRFALAIPADDSTSP